MISCVAMLCFGCDSGKGIQKTSDTQNNTDEIDTSESDQTEVSWIEKSAVLEKEDGWVYYMYVGYDAEMTELQYVTFNGYNEKYERIDGYNIPVYDDDGKTIIDEIEAQPVLFRNKKYEADVDAIETYFTEQAFDEQITEDDLKTLQLTAIDKSDLVTMYNEILEKETPKAFGPLLLTETYIKTQEVDNDVKVQAAYYSNYGYLQRIRLDVLYGEDYLSDLIAADTATEEQKEVWTNLKTLETYMLDNNTIDISEVLPDDSALYSNLELLLSQASQVG
jgi:hypothetical protein